MLGISNDKPFVWFTDAKILAPIIEFDSQYSVYVSIQDGDANQVELCMWKLIIWRCNEHAITRLLRFVVTNLCKIFYFWFESNWKTYLLCNRQYFELIHWVFVPNAKHLIVSSNKYYNFVIKAFVVILVCCNSSNSPYVKRERIHKTWFSFAGARRFKLKYDFFSFSNYLLGIYCSRIPSNFQIKYFGTILTFFWHTSWYFKRFVYTNTTCHSK